MPNRGEVPDEAMSAAWAEVEGTETLTLSLLEAAVAAAASSIRNQERQCGREELRNELIYAERQHPGYLARWAALDTLDPSGAKEWLPDTHEDRMEMRELEAEADRSDPSKEVQGDG